MTIKHWIWNNDGIIDGKTDLDKDGIQMLDNEYTPIWILRVTPVPNFSRIRRTKHAVKVPQFLAG
jgi:hypothetical protein